VSRTILSEARSFNRKPRFLVGNCNDLGRAAFTLQKLYAYRYSLAWQDSIERKMEFPEWEQYAQQGGTVAFDLQSQNTLSTALLRSGLGIKNIDCYIKKGDMDPLLVKYNVPADSVINDYHAILYERINTSQRLSPTSLTTAEVSGYYFKRGKNYILRFSPGGFLQVAKPTEIRSGKEGKTIQLAYSQKHNISALSASEIKKLIFEK